MAQLWLRPFQIYFGPKAKYWPNGDLRIAVQKMTSRWISVERVVNKETYAVLCLSLIHI